MTAAWFSPIGPRRLGHVARRRRTGAGWTGSAVATRKGLDTRATQHSDSVLADPSSRSVGSNHVMKVVLFCGGYGLRMRDGATDLPKPMIMVGHRPLIWHVMRYYAHFGHDEFILCLGYGAHHIKDYFLDYHETESNDFVLRRGEVELQGSDIADWTIHFVHTGLESPIGERL